MFLIYFGNCYFFTCNSILLRVRNQVRKNDCPIIFVVNHNTNQFTRYIIILWIIYCSLSPIQSSNIIKKTGEYFVYFIAFATALWGSNSTIRLPTSTLPSSQSWTITVFWNEKLYSRLKRQPLFYTLHLTSPKDENKYPKD